MSSMGAAGAPVLDVIPLGGLGEFGMNMMLVACGGTAVLIDAGRDVSRSRNSSALIS